MGLDVKTFIAHEHMFDATQQLRLGWGGMGCDNSIPCTCEHVQCYATAAFLAWMFTSLRMNTCLMLRNCLAHEHMFDATQLMRFLLVCSGSLHMNTCLMLPNCCVSCWYVHAPCT